MARVALIAGAGLVAANAAPGIGSVGRLSFPGVVRRLPGAAPVVALTFDDGPHPEGTPAVLDTLERLGLSVTFFVMGDAAARHREIVCAAHAAGHQIALHGGRHLPHPLRNPRTLIGELAAAQATIEDITGAAVTAIRAPFGATSATTLLYARRHGLLVAGWTRWGRDWKRHATGRAIAECVTRRLLAGDIILLHDSDRYAAHRCYMPTNAALPAIAGQLAAAGLGTTTLPVLPLTPRPARSAAARP